MKVSINGKEVESGEMTILELAKRENIDIPTLCYRKEFGPEGRCRMCVVEVDGKLVTSCDTKIKEGMKILTNSDAVLKSRAITQRLIDNREKRIPKRAATEPLNWDVGKCIVCKACTKACDKLQCVSAITEVGRGMKTRISTPFELLQSNSPCTFCGQCIYFCDRDAISERDDIPKVLEALADKRKYVIVQTAPSIRASIGEFFGLTGQPVTGKLATALRKLGFHKIFDTDFAADITTYEETHEFLERVRKKKLPHLTSCCPAWIRFAEYYYPELLVKISTTKSPHMMMGSLIKTYYAKKAGINPKDIVVVSIMPCVAKKFEITRPETNVNGLANVDIVLTTRELGKLLKMKNIDLKKMEDGKFDEPLGISSGGAAIYGVTGGVTENVLRSACYLMGKKLDKIEFESVRGFDGIKEATIELNGAKIRIAIASGLGNIRKVLDDMKSGKKQYDILEFMACPGGCIGGGGQPKSDDPEIKKKRAEALFTQDRKLDFRIANENPALPEIYKFLGKPLSKNTKKHLHTSFKMREIKFE